MILKKKIPTITLNNSSTMQRINRRREIVGQFFARIGGKSSMKTC
jgi:hypothetical protein